MAKDINLSSQSWVDFVFDGKNKKYGAYQIRLDSSKRNIIALLCVLGLTVLIAFLPLIIQTVSEATARRNTADGLVDTTVLAELQDIEDRVPEEQIIREIQAPPPPKLISTVQFVAPEIVPSEEVTEENQIKTQQEIREDNRTISIFDVEGDDTADAIDLADLEQQKIVIQDPTIEPEPIRFAEQNPEFPGGIEALQRFINDNVGYPQAAVDAGIQGQVILEFVVNTNGMVDRIKIIKGLDPMLDAEAIKVVRSLPKWTPGRQNGKPVPVYYILPITFKLG